MKKRLSWVIAAGVGMLLASAGTAQADIPGCPPGVQDVTYCQSVMATLASDSLIADRNGNIGFPIKCVAPAVRHCRGFFLGKLTGKIKKQRRTRTHRRRKAKRVLIDIANTGFDIGDGQTGAVGFHLTRAQRKLLVKARVLHGHLIVVAFTAGGVAQTTVEDFTLKAKKKKKRGGR